jgi:hypothetical protein
MQILQIQLTKSKHLCFKKIKILKKQISLKIQITAYKKTI